MCDKTGWKTVRLGEICKLCRGVRVVRSQLSHGRYTVFQNSLIPLGKYDRCNTPSDTTFIIAAGSAGEIGYSQEQFWAADDCYYLIPNDGVVSKFLFYSLLGHQSQISGSVRRGSVPRLARDVIENLELCLPEGTTQHKITDALSAVDSQIFALQQLLTKYESIKKATVKLLMTPGDGWKKIPLGEIGEIAMCKRILKSQTSEYGEIPFYKIGTFGKTPDAFISRELFDEYKHRFSYPNKGDVLLSAAGTIGRTVVFNGENAYFQDSNIVWIANDEKIVYNSFLHMIYSQIIWQTENGGTVGRLYNANIRETVVDVPSKDEQKRIVSIIDILNNKISLLADQLKKTMNVKQAMLQYFFGD